MYKRQAQESVTPESTAQDLPEQNNSAPSQADVELDVPDAPEGKITLVLGGIGLRDDTLASLVNNFNAENTKYTVVILSLIHISAPCRITVRQGAVL